MLRDITRVTMSVMLLLVIGSTQAETILPSAKFLDGVDDYGEESGAFNALFGEDFKLEFTMTPLSGNQGFTRILDNSGFRVYLDTQPSLVELVVDVVGSAGITQARAAIAPAFTFDFAIEVYESNGDVVIDIFEGTTLTGTGSNNNELPLAPSSTFIGTSAVSPGGLLFHGYVGPIEINSL